MQGQARVFCSWLGSAICAARSKAWRLQRVLQHVQGLALLLVLNLAAPSGRPLSCIPYDRESERGKACFGVDV